MYIGIDLGSRTVKMAVWDGERMVDYQIAESGFEPHRQAEKMLSAFTPTAVVATGYGRHLAAEYFADGVITEIKAHAAGIYHHFPGCTTLVDVGGQDSKVIAVNGAGKVSNFQMNDKCAAGTGRFLEIMAGSLAFTLAEFGAAALASEQEVQINSMCTVFAESEVISMKNRGIPRAHIARAVHSSVADRLAAMLARLGYGEMVAFSGGVARNPCMVALLQQRLPEVLVVVPKHPDLTGALGAALHAAKVC
ncbi:MAG: 3-hydroxyacyl-ACP dehydratase [Proteobacteria bacterium]|nr:3-hydroxyacyl-ACP dehydratase [Pseudomonadota bacterium]MBU1639403.1 3-hydroxyacyl-ACP dehydratase [Pseudomonadota bacterium]